VYASPLSPAARAGRLRAAGLKDLWYYCAEQRALRGLPLYAEPGAQEREVTESIGIRESAALSDFPNILGNNLYRAIQDWYEQFQQAWQEYYLVREHVDYRPVVYAFISELEDLRALRQESDYEDSPFSDKGYSLSLQKYGRKLTLPYIVIENDDKGVVAQLPDKWMRAVDRTLQKLVVRTNFEANVTSYDGNAIFTSGRGNLLTGGSSTLTAANVQSGIAYVQGQTGDPDLNPGAAPTNVQPKWLVVPTALEFNAFTILHSSLVVAAGTAGTVTIQGNINPLADPQARRFYMPVVPLVERFLTNATAWYILPDSRYAAVTVALRQGRRLRPRVAVNIPFRRSIIGGERDPYELAVDDQTFLASIDLGVGSGWPWASYKSAGA
jgi:hypothetical protein